MDVVGGVAVLIALGAVFSVMLGGSRTYSNRRAATSVRSVTGGNFSSMLAVVGIAALVLETGQLPFLPTEAAPWLATLAVVLVVGTVVAGRVTPVLTALIGIALLLMTLGLGETLILVVVTLMLLWLLGVLRGWTS